MTHLLQLIAVCALLASCSMTPAAELHVAPDGSGDNPGTREKPFASLYQARDAVRQRGEEPPSTAGPICVWIHGGTYRFEQTLLLSAEDSGTQTSLVVYRAWADEEVRLSGGCQLDTFGTVTDEATLTRLDPAARQHVVQAELRGLGIDELGELSDRFRGGGGSAELFFDDRRMQPARWPNEGFVTIEAVIDRGISEDGRAVRGGTFVYADERPARWNVDRGVWLHGYWCHDWSDECLRIASIDPANRQITLAAPHGYGIGASSTWNRHPRRYYAVHLLEELDRPAEWYLDRKAGRLYFWPPKPLDGARVVLSLLAKPLISLSGASHVTLQGVTLETSRGDGVAVSGGSGNRVIGCTLRNLAGSGVVVRGGSGHGVVGCHVHDVGKGGIHLSAGDRKTLAPAECFAEDNHIHHFGRLQKTYAAGVHVGGVGNRVAHNLIHDAPHSAILYGGNEHTIELNEVHRVALETSDVGACYTGRDWTSRGNLLRWNYIHDLPSFGVCGTMGIYLDDCDSGDRLVGNVFYRAGRAAFIGGGRDNLVANNLFIECLQAVHLDARGLSRIQFDTPGGRDSWDLPAKAARLDYQNPPWSTRYPKLARVMQEEPRLPLGNVIERNVAVRCEKWLNAGGQVREMLDRITLRDNLVLEDEDPGFVDAAGQDFRLEGDSIVFEKVSGFERIPFDRIGPRRPAPDVTAAP